MKFRRIIFFTLLIITAWACGRKPVEIPPGVLTDKEMISVLTDFHLAQSAVPVMQMKDSVRYTLNDYTDYILKSRNIPREKFTASITFYSQHPDLLEDIYDEVINELSKLQSETEIKK